jgi:hypothetical protein
MIISFISFGCFKNDSEDTSHTKSHPDLISSDLTIEFHDKECGEWGGHSETIKVDFNKISFEKTKIDCDSLVRDYKPGDSSVWTMVPFEYVELETKKNLTTDEQEMIIEYLVSTLRARLNEENDHALGFAQGLTSRVRIRNSDSSLVISSSNKKSLKKYSDLVNDLRLLNPRIYIDD